MNRWAILCHAYGAGPSRGKLLRKLAGGNSDQLPGKSIALTTPLMKDSITTSVTE